MLFASSWDISKENFSGSPAGLLTAVMEEGSDIGFAS
jgi:hypothetical protein